MSILNYYNELERLIECISVREKSGREIGLARGADSAVELIRRAKEMNKKLIFVGNGASAAISSHQSADYSKNGEVRAMTFSDPALLTCMGNDFGYEYVFAKPVDIFADPGDILIAISSSGRSKNIINAVKASKKKRCLVITLSGFLPSNPLVSIGDLNFHVPSTEYSHVEIIHHSICHYILEMLIEHNRAEVNK